MKQVKNILMTIMIALVLMTVQAKAETAPKITIDNNLVQTDVDPVIKNGTTFVPLRVVSEKLGFETMYDPSSRLVYLFKRNATNDFDKVLVFGVDSNAYYVVNPVVGHSFYQPLSNRTFGSITYAMIEDCSTKKLLDNNIIFQKNGRTMVPIRVISEALGRVVRWDNANRTVHVEGEISNYIDTLMSKSTELLKIGDTYETGEYVDVVRARDQYPKDTLIFDGQTFNLNYAIEEQEGILNIRQLQKMADEEKVVCSGVFKSGEPRVHLISGHSGPGMPFMKMTEMKVGDEIIVTDGEGISTKYKVMQEETLYKGGDHFKMAGNTQVFMSCQFIDDVIVIQTCHYPADGKMYSFICKPIDF